MTTNKHFPVFLFRNRSIKSRQHTSNGWISIADMNRILRLLRMEHKEIGMNAHLHKHRSITKNKTITQIVIGKTKFSHFTNTRKTVVRGDTILQMIITTNMYSLTIGGILLVLGLQTESLIIQIGNTAFGLSSSSCCKSFTACLVAKIH